MKTMTELATELVATGLRAESERRRFTEEIRQRLAAGESTGDPLQDFALWMYGADHMQALPQWRTLEGRLTGKAGEFILMIERHERLDAVRGLDLPVDETFRLGILMKDRLAPTRTEQPGHGSLAFPTQAHAVEGRQRVAQPARREGGPMRLSGTALAFWLAAERDIRLTGRTAGLSRHHAAFCLGADAERPLTELELIIGNAEIDDWCRRGALHDPPGSPNRRRCSLIATLASKLDASVSKLPAVVASKATRRNEVMSDLEKRAAELKSAMEELRGEAEPTDPAGLVRRIRGSQRAIHALLDEAETLRIDTPVVQRLRAAHPRTPAA